MKSFKVLTGNVLGVPCATNRKSRIEQLSKVIVQARKVDAMFFQETYCLPDVHLLVNAGRSIGMPYHVLFRNGPGFYASTSPGMLIVSRFKIVQTKMHAFSCSGKRLKIWQMDGLHAKAVGMAKLDTPLGFVHVYVTHLVSIYVDDKMCNFAKDEYHVERIIQAHEVAHFVNSTSAGAELVVVVGDLNATPEHPAYQHLMSLAGLRDAAGHLEDREATYAAHANELCGDATPSVYDYILFKGSAVAKAYQTERCMSGLSDHEFISAEIGLVDSARQDVMHYSELHGMHGRHKQELMRLLELKARQCDEDTRWHAKACANLVLAVTVFLPVPVARDVCVMTIMCELFNVFECMDLSSCVHQVLTDLRIEAGETVELQSPGRTLVEHLEDYGAFGSGQSCFLRSLAPGASGDFRAKRGLPRSS